MTFKCPLLISFANSFPKLLLPTQTALACTQCVLLILLITIVQLSLLPLNPTKQLQGRWFEASSGVWGQGMLHRVG